MRMMLGMAVCVLCIGTAWADESVPVLLFPASGVVMDGQSESRVGSGLSDERSEPARFHLNRDLLSPQMLGAEDLLFDEFMLPTRADNVWRMQIQSRDWRSRESYTLVARPSHCPHSYAILSFEKGMLYAVLHDAHSGITEIRSLDQDQVEVVGVDQDVLKRCGGGIQRSESDESEALFVSQEQFEPLSTSMVTVDVAIVYTDLARLGAGGQFQIQNRIQTAVTQANLSHENSDVAIEYRLVYLGEVDYVESGDMHLDLERLTNDDGYFLNEIHCLRNLYGADLVTLVTETGQYGGLAWIMCSAHSSFAANGFSVVDQGALPFYTLAHEWGHNFGCDHDHDHPSGCRLNSDSYGYRFWQGGQQRRTIMAYEPGNQVAHFSNPDVSFFGSPTGIVSIHNNARTLRQTATLVAGFRPRQPPQVPPTPTQVQVIAVSTNAARITWQGCGAEIYTVRRGGIIRGMTSLPEFTESGLTPGSYYCWEVIASIDAMASAASAPVCVTIPHTMPFVLDGQADHATYLQSDPGMRIYAAIRGDELYVATWSSGIHPGNVNRSDHFLFVSDELLPSASVVAPWGKSGMISVPANKPYIGAESNNDFVGWFNAHPSSRVLKSRYSERLMEGVINLVDEFGAVPDVLYLAAAAYNTQDGGALVTQAPEGSGPNIDPHEFLAVHTLAIRDELGDGVYDRLDPLRDFLTHEINTDSQGQAMVRWATVPGQRYVVEQADSPRDPWHTAATVTADANDLFLTWTDPTPNPPSRRVYRVRLD